MPKALPKQNTILTHQNMIKERKAKRKKNLKAYPKYDQNGIYTLRWKSM